MLNETYLRAPDLLPFVGKHVRIERHASPTHPVRSVLEGTLDGVQEYAGSPLPLGGTLRTERGSSGVDLSCVVSIRELPREVGAAEWFARYDPRREVQADEVGLRPDTDEDELREIVRQEEAHAADNLETLVGAETYLRELREWLAP